MWGFDIKDVLKLVFTVTIVGLCVWGINSILSGSEAKGTIKVIEQQGVANEQENRRAMDAIAIDSTINTESDSSFIERMQSYWTSQGDSQPEPAESLQDSGHDDTSHKENGRFTDTEVEAIEALQDSGVLPATYPTVLPCKELINLYSEDGQTLVGQECVE